MGERRAGHAVQGPPGVDAASDAATSAAGALGWDGVVLPPTRLFGSRLVPVVVLDPVAHARRTACGDGPQLDEDVLTVWEWPQSAGCAPPPALRLDGMLFTARRGWRLALAEALQWRGFAPAAVLVPVEEVDQDCRWECALQGVGLVAIRTVSGCQPYGMCLSEMVVGAEQGRRVPARRRTADRWLEEVLYGHALAASAFPLGAPRVEADV